MKEKILGNLSHAIIIAVVGFMSTTFFAVTHGLAGKNAERSQQNKVEISVLKEGNREFKRRLESIEGKLDKLIDERAGFLKGSRTIGNLDKLTF